MPNIILWPSALIGSRDSRLWRINGNNNKSNNNRPSMESLIPPSPWCFAATKLQQIHFRQSSVRNERVNRPVFKVRSSSQQVRSFRFGRWKVRTFETSVSSSLLILTFVHTWNPYRYMVTLYYSNTEISKWWVLFVTASQYYQELGT